MRESRFCCSSEDATPGLLSLLRRRCCCCCPCCWGFLSVTYSSNSAASVSEGVLETSSCEREIWTKGSLSPMAPAPAPAWEETCC